MPQPSSSGERARVFGIGFQRTGTASLATACSQLGWNCKHGDFKRFPGSLDLNDPVYGQHDMFCDTPYFHLYDKIDHKFPNAKFILTIRPTDAWLTSLKWLYDNRRSWNKWPAILQHQILIYGISDFDAATMRVAYESHNQSVRDYFADRTNRLLVTDLTAGDGWSPLCQFLGCATPQEPFPHQNRAKPNASSRG